MTDRMEKERGRIAVIGGGASGCMAAIAAARAGCRVTVFEKNEKIARKIYATGNGRCNLTNLFLDASCYRTKEEIDPSRILSAIGQFPQEALLHFFLEEGVPVHDRDGYVYPRTDQAETIAGTLEKCMRQSDVRVRTSCAVLGIEKVKDKSGNSIFRVRYSASARDKTESEGRGKKADKASAPGGGKSRADKTAAPGDQKKKATGKEKDKRRKNTQENINYSKNLNYSKNAELSFSAGREETFDCDAVILCTGGMAGPSFGCSGDGYRLAKHFSHSLLAPLPALTRLECANSLLRRAAGVRCHASVTLLEEKEDGHLCSHGCEDGELQITENSISGIPVFQLSGTAAELLAKGKKVFARIDFLPEFTDQAFREDTQRRLAQDRGQMLADLFLGLVHRRIIDLVLAQAGLQAEMKARRFTDEELREMLRRFRSFELEVTGTGGFDHAQVTRGGIPLSETDLSFASLKCGGLFLAGELLDVDGRCGGYNLQWAMTSGLLAGRGAARYADEHKPVPAGPDD